MLYFTTLCASFLAANRAVQIAMEPEPKYDVERDVFFYDFNDPEVSIPDEQIEVIQSYADAQAQRTAQRMIEEQNTAEGAIEHLVEKYDGLKKYGTLVFHMVRAQHPEVPVQNPHNWNSIHFLESSNLDCFGCGLRVLDALIAAGAVLTSIIWHRLLDVVGRDRCFKHLLLRGHDISPALSWRHPSDGSDLMPHVLFGVIDSGTPFNDDSRFIIKKMIEYGLDINTVTDSSGRSLLYHMLNFPSAAENNFDHLPVEDRPEINGTRELTQRKFNVLQCLIENGYDLTAETRPANLPVVRAARLGMVSTMLYLVDHGADIRLPFEQFSFREPKVSDLSRPVSIHEIEVRNLIRCVRRLFTRKYMHATAVLVSLLFSGLQDDVAMECVGAYRSEVRDWVGLLEGVFSRCHPQSERQGNLIEMMQGFAAELQTTLSGKPAKNLAGYPL